MVGAVQSVIFELPAIHITVLERAHTIGSVYCMYHANFEGRLISTRAAEVLTQLHTNKYMVMKNEYQFGGLNWIVRKSFCKTMQLMVIRFCWRAINNIR